MTHPSGYAPLLHNLQPDLLHRGNKAARLRHQRLAGIAFLQHGIRIEQAAAEGGDVERLWASWEWIEEARARIRKMEAG